MMNDFLTALSFISRLPVKLNNTENFETNIKKAPSYFTLVGYIPGFIYFFTSLWSENIFIRIAGIATGFYLFDLFHFDGLLDMLDGFLNQSDKEKRLLIMSKGNVGPFAVFYGTLYVIAFYNLFSYLDPTDFLFGSVFGRYSMSILISISKPAKNTGLGAMFFPAYKYTPLIAALFSAPMLCLGCVKFILSFLVSFLTAIFVKIISEKKISGITGDVIGGTSLLSQMFILLSIAGVEL
ncbi:adenosylcobinamide-GDP ribazoletransferase [Pseudothermotoga sp.]|uniref:adenosylcobinamide-GDP ribazoletransferase n=1 Tax=Pseudothermotoga sp. TaxID=2033661 RepID=UPI002582B0AE|nr:adenosylcobinamide-GDP ribazoletransferase [Pseudothermotoga sp.]MDK2884393.1 adenosylcobinamide-GDP ribazoletransferase [Pseudothermotoga sp.]